MKNKIYLNDFLNLTQEEIDNTKIKFNIHNSYESPEEVYLKEPEKMNNQWLFWRNKKKYFRVGQVGICLIKLTNETYLLTTIKKITKDLNIYNGINYEGVEIEKYKPYYGRVIIKYHKYHQVGVVWANTSLENLEVLQILPTLHNGQNFPRYDNIKLSFEELSLIITRGKKDWTSALSKQKGVYIITDIKTGKHYIGSAYNNNMLLSRWKNYIDTGHGGNKDLRDLTQKVMNINGIFSLAY